MKADFDRAAQNYDAAFTHSVIGKLQRGIVYDAFSKRFGKDQLDILEINCGTGQDAIWLAKHSHKVIATDISHGMINIAKSKSTGENPVFEQGDINHIAEIYANKKFDLVFSDFGGLNCLSAGELEKFLKKSTKILKPNGQLFLVIMPKNTLWEWVYFTVKGQFSSVFRRRKTSAQANVDGEKVQTFYYNPKDIVLLAGNTFEIREITPVGFFVPPSYLEPFFKNKPQLMGFLNGLEQKISRYSRLSKFADHYLIVLQKK